MDKPKQKKSYIEISDNYNLSIESLCIPEHYRNDLESILIPHGLILDRTEALASQIFNEYCNENLICFCVLKGGYRFFADLTQILQNMNRTSEKGKSIPMKMDFINSNKIKREKTNQTYIDELNYINNKNVLIVTDCIETGETIKEIIEDLKIYSPKHIKCCSLLVKRSSRNGYMPDYIGFSIPQNYFVGYVLDLNEHFLDLEHICVLKESSKQKYVEE